MRTIIKVMRDNFSFYAPYVCLSLCILGVIIGVYGSIRGGNEEATKEQEVNVVADAYREVIEPTMLKDNVKTVCRTADDVGSVQIGYGISDINTMIEFKRSDPIIGDCEFELWNNMEQYYVHVIYNGEEKTCKINMDDEARSHINVCVTTAYLTTVSYLGVANVDRMESFEDIGDGEYVAQSAIEDAKYSLTFNVEDNILRTITMCTEENPDTSVTINFSEYHVTEFAEYEKTEDTCDVSYVTEMFDKVTEVTGENEE